MPYLEMFGRRWLFGTDDLVFPGLLGLLMRGIWLMVMSCLLYRYYQWTFNCVTGGLLVRIYLFGIVVMHSIIIILTMVLMNRSAQGAIYDTKARRVVPYLLVLKIILFVPEIALNVLGTVWTYSDYIQCDNEHLTNTVVKIGVIFNWAMLGVLVFVLAMTLDPVGTLKLQEGTNGNIDMDTILHHRVTRRWVKIFRRFFCCLIIDEHSHEAFSQVAGLMSSTFRNKDITPSDFIAGLILLRREQSHESKEEIRPATYTVTECFNGKPNWMSLKKARHYLQLSISIYGWSLSIYNNCVRGLFKKIPKFFCCACFRAKPTVVNEGNYCLCDFVVIRCLSKLHSKDILYASFVNRIFEVPFFVTADHETSSIVITIRGSSSIRDIFTDLTAIVGKLDAHGAPPDSYAHNGMLYSAKYVLSELKEHNVLEKAFAKFPEYDLIITGHSLGAGTAVLLAFYLRSNYPNLKVYSFSTPAALLSREAARVAEEFTLSIGVGDDMVMYMTIDSIEDLLTNMIQVLKSCKLPKHRIFLNRFGYALFGASAKNLESTRCHQNPSEELAARRHPTIGLYPPGHILHITKKKKSKEQKKSDKKSGSNSHKYDYEMRWATPEDFKELRIMPHMLSDHLSVNVLKTINNVLREQRNEEQ